MRDNQPRRDVTVACLLLLVLGVSYLCAALSDLAADARIGRPTDHTSTFAQATDLSWAQAVHSSPGLTRYITLLAISPSDAAGRATNGAVRDVAAAAERETASAVSAGSRT